jgi:hypothetical protein
VHKPSTIVGKLRSNAGGSLDAWHLSQFFGAAPTLSEGFIQDNPPFDRVVAVPAEPHFPKLEGIHRARHRISRHGASTD